MSKSTQHLETLSLEQQSEIDAIAEAFEAALADSADTGVKQFLPADESLRRPAVIELLHAEVESRARRGLDSKLPERLSEYAEVIDDEQTALEMVISDVELRERLGKHVRADDVIAQHPELAEPLAEYFRSCGESIDSGLVRLNCPHCQNPISAKHDSNLGVLCPTCGSQFRIEDKDVTWRPSKLPNLGRFQLLEAVGRGAFGTVYRARDLELHRIVAVKVPRSGAFALEEDEERFIREARSAAQLSHPGIVPVYEVGRADAFPFIVAEYVDGVTLNDVLSARRLGYQESAALVAELADALQHAHEQGVVHRDMKPSNVMMQRESDSNSGTKQLARLMDFGLALRDDGEVTVTLDGQPLGTPAYMSPEQARGEGHKVDGRTDIYSLGVILYQLLVGELPFRGNSRMLVHQVQYDEPKTPRSLNDTVPRDLETICLKAMAKEPQRRYQSAAELADDIRRFLRGEPIHARSIGTMERTWRWCRRNPLATALYGMVLIALVLVSIAYSQAMKAQRAESAWRTAFLARLENPATDIYYLDTMEFLVHEVERTSPSAGAECRTQMISAYDEHLQSQITQGRELEVIERVLDRWAQWDAKSERRLRAALREQTQTSFFLAAPFDGWRDILEGELVHRDNRLTPAPNDKSVWRKTKYASAGDAELIVEYGNDWAQASMLGLGIDFPREPNEKRGYRLYFRTVAPKSTGRLGKTEAPPVPSFEQARKTDSLLLCELYRGESLLQRRSITPPSNETLRLRITRDGQMLIVQVNDQEPIKFVEWFLLDQSGVFSVMLPANVSLQRLQAKQQAASTARPLAAGDQLIEQEDYEAAVQEYQRLSKGLEGKQTLQDECRFKEGIALLRLNRNEPAREIFTALVQSNGDWSLPAAAHLWLLHLQADRHDDAESVLQALSTQFDFADMALRLPNATRQEIINEYLQAGSIGGYDSIRPTPNRVRDLRRVLSAQKLLNAREDVLLNTKWTLVHALHKDGNLGEALGLVNEVAAAQMRADIRYLVADQHSQILCELDRPEAALQVLNGQMLDADGNLTPEREMLLLHRARVYARLERWTEAKADVDQLVQLGEKDATLHRSVLVEAYLAQGFVWESSGESDEAVRGQWRKGLELARKTITTFDSLSLVVLGSLLGQLNESDADLIVELVVMRSNVSPVLRYLRQRNLPNSLVASVLRNMWRTKRGRDLARRLSLNQIPYGESDHTQVLLTAAEVWRQCLLGGDAYPPELEEPVEQMCWEMSLAMFDLYAEEKLNELHVIQLAQSWRGTMNIFGWAGVAGALPPEVRGRLAYVFAHRLETLKQVDDAKRMLETAINNAQAVEDAFLAELAEEKLRKLNATSENAKTPQD